MGAWGPKAFENDAALNWLADLEAEGAGVLHSLLSKVAATSPRDWLDIDDGSAAIAAAELVAAALSLRQDRLTKNAAFWLEENSHDIDPEDLTLARRAVERVLGASSELKELWEEQGHETEWHKNVRELLGRLGAGREKHSSGNMYVHSRQSLLTYFTMLGLTLTDEQRKRIETSRNPEELRRWLSRVVQATSVEEVLDDDDE